MGIQAEKKAEQDARMAKFKMFVLAFILGGITSAIAVVFLGYDYVNQIKAENQELLSPVGHPEAVQWIIDNPQYAELVKQQHDNYVQAAKDAFEQNLGIETQNSRGN